MFPVTHNPHKPKGKTLKMTVDDKLSDSIPSPMPSHGGFRMLVVAPPGCGKTSFVFSHILEGGCYHKVFDNLRVVIPPNSRASFAKDPLSTHDPKRIHSELTAEVLDAALTDAKLAAECGENSLLIIDDSAYDLKNKSILRKLMEIFFNARHLRLSTILISQTLRAVPNKLRLSVSHLVSFQPANKLEAAIIASEYIFLEPRSLSALFGQCFQDRFDHILIDVAARRLYRNYDEIHLPRAF